MRALRSPYEVLLTAALLETDGKVLPRIIAVLGFDLSEPRYKDAKVHTAIGEERGYWLRVAQLDVLGPRRTSRNRVSTWPPESRWSRRNELRVANHAWIVRS